jgi:hypothetical protein
LPVCVRRAGEPDSVARTIAASVATVDVMLARGFGNEPAHVMSSHSSKVPTIRGSAYLSLLLAALWGMRSKESP